MAATLLSLIEDICDEIGLPRPSAVVSSTDQTTLTLLAHANREGRDLMRAHAWTALTRLHQITTVNGTAEYSLPTDYSRLTPDTEWDDANLQPLIGPIDGPEWRTLKSGGIGSGVVGRRFRIFRASTGTGRKVYVDPTPSVDGDTLSFEYISTSWVLDTDGTTLHDAWQADTDTFLLNEDLMRLGVQVRYRRSKGLEFGSEADEYMQLFKTLTAQDRPARTLNLAQRSSVPRYLDGANLPETGYGN